MQSCPCPCIWCDEGVAPEIFNFGSGLGGEDLFEWLYDAGDQTGFEIWRGVDGNPMVMHVAVGAGIFSWGDVAAPGAQRAYKVRAITAGGFSDFSPTWYTTPDVPILDFFTQSGALNMRVVWIHPVAASPGWLTGYRLEKKINVGGAWTLWAMPGPTDLDITGPHGANPGDEIYLRCTAIGGTPGQTLATGWESSTVDFGVINIV